MRGQPSGESIHESANFEMSANQKCVIGEFDSAFESRQSPHQPSSGIDALNDAQLDSSASGIQRNRDADGQSESRSEKESVRKLNHPFSIQLL